MTTLADIIAWCEQVAANARDGNASALDALAQLRAVAGACGDAVAAVDGLAIAEAEQYHEKTFVHHGLKWTRKEGSRRFKFDHIPQWSEAQASLKMIEDRAKSAALQLEKGLRTITDDAEVVDPAIITYGKPSLTIER